jgi:hypothetical protein
MPANKVEVDTQRLNQILKNLPGKREENNRAIAFRVEGRTKAKSPVDTGANRSSIYVVCGGNDGFDKARTAALGRRAKATVTPLPKPQGDDAHVGPSMSYSMELEFGGHGRAARPYLVPAVSETANELSDQWRNIADG